MIAGSYVNMISLDKNIFGIPGGMLTTA